jgi:hypothetical protein
MCGRAGVEGRGGDEVVAYITHAILSGNAIEKITKSALDELVVTDTIPLSPDAKQCGRIRQLSVAGAAGRDHSSHPRRGFGEQLVPGLMGGCLKRCRAPKVVIQRSAHFAAELRLLVPGTA